MDRARFDDFFTALSCGVIYKSQRKQLPPEYTINHIYHRLVDNADSEARAIQDGIDRFYDQKPLDLMAFGNPDTRNECVYTVEIYGLPGFRSSITIVHKFFGVFKVTSMLLTVRRTLAAIRSQINIGTKSRNAT